MSSKKVKTNLLSCAVFFLFLKLGASFHEWIKPGQDKASKKMMIKKPGFVYLMKTYGAPFFKIGQATDPEQRRMNLQTGCPYPLVIEGKWDVENMNVAEKAVQKEMQGYSVANNYPALKWKTEWYEIKDQTTEDVKNYISKILK